MLTNASLPGAVAERASTANAIDPCMLKAPMASTASFTKADPGDRVVSATSRHPTGHTQINVHANYGVLAAPWYMETFSRLAPLANGR